MGESLSEEMDDKSGLMGGSARERRYMSVTEHWGGKERGEQGREEDRRGRDGVSTTPV